MFFVFNLESQQSPKQSRRITIRRSTRSKEPPLPTRPVELSTPITEDISDDDMPLIDIRRRKRKSIDTLSMPPSNNDSIIPLGTDLQSLPGHTQEDPRDVRFLAYTDSDNLSNHMDTCLRLHSTSFPSAKPSIFRSRNNVLKKIFRIHYIKFIRPNLVKEKKISFDNTPSSKQQSPSLMSSATATSFRTDWNAHSKHRGSSHQPTPKNTFHILQLNPRHCLDLSNNTTSSIMSDTSPIQTLEHVKDILARTYYPHLYTAVQRGYQFGAKSTFPHTRQLISTYDDIPVIKQRPESPYFVEDSTPTTLQSSPPDIKTHSIVYPDSPIYVELNGHEKQSPFLSNHFPQIIDDDIKDITPILIKESIVVLTPTPIPHTSSSLLLDKGKKSTNDRKRKSSSVANTNIVERKKKRIIASPSPPPPPPPPPPLNNQYEDISNAERYSIESVQV